MKLKKVNKSFSDCNCILDFNTLSREVNCTARDKKYRIRFNNVHYENGFYKDFPYKNLELTYWREYIIFAFI